MVRGGSRLRHWSTPHPGPALQASDEATSGSDFEIMINGNLGI
jgi:hypothetical protein